MQENQTSFTIKHWSDDDKPREKLLRKGRSILSDAELIALLIGSGSERQSAVALSKKILASVNNNLNDLGQLSVAQLMQFKGIGKAKAVTIAAALEIGRRRRAGNTKKVKRISDSQNAFDLLYPVLGELPHEEFWVAYLNNSNTLVHLEQLSKGGITHTVVDIRLVMKNALDYGAVALVLAHNHPSATLKPSSADKAITQKLKKACEAMDIKILDHLIIAGHEYFSFADNQLL